MAYPTGAASFTHLSPALHCLLHHLEGLAPPLRRHHHGKHAPSHSALLLQLDLAQLGQIKQADNLRVHLCAQELNLQGERDKARGRSCSCWPTFPRFTRQSLGIIDQSGPGPPACIRLQSKLHAPGHAAISGSACQGLLSLVSCARWRRLPGLACTRLQDTPRNKTALMHAARTGILCPAGACIAHLRPV